MLSIHDVINICILTKVGGFMVRTKDRNLIHYNGAVTRVCMDFEKGNCFTIFYTNE